MSLVVEIFRLCFCDIKAKSCFFDPSCKYFIGKLKINDGQNS